MSSERFITPRPVLAVSVASSYVAVRIQSNNRWD
jgi:hypothetical protein